MQGERQMTRVQPSFYPSVVARNMERWDVPRTQGNWGGTVYSLLSHSLWGRRGSEGLNRHKRPWIAARRAGVQIGYNNLCLMNFRYGSTTISTDWSLTRVGRLLYMCESIERKLSGFNKYSLIREYKWRFEGLERERIKLVELNWILERMHVDVLPIASSDDALGTIMYDLVVPARKVVGKMVRNEWFGTMNRLKWVIRHDEPMDG